MRQAGFIFIMTLITVSVISLLILGCLSHVLMYYKAINTIKKQHHSFYQIENSAIAFANGRLFDASCIIYDAIANEDLLNLLKEEGCSITLGSEPFKYLLEELGDFPCLITQTTHGKFSTSHRRISFLSLSDKSTTLFLQMRLINPIPIQPCDDKEHSVNLGVSSWLFEVL